MSQIIIYQDPTEGNLCVVYPTEGTTIEAAVAASVPAGVAHKVVSTLALPADRYFRNAWKLGAGKVEIDVEGAKEVQRERWRKLRAPKLAALDVESIKALEKGDAKRRAEISDQKQALRDVTNTALPDDIEGIRNTIPTILL